MMSNITYANYGKNRIWTPIILIISFFTTFAISGLNPTEKKVLPLIPIDEYTLYLDKQVPALMDFYDIPGSSIALVKEGKLAWSEAYGIADVQTGRKLTKDTPMRVQSISKSITAWGIMKLVEQGKIELDAPILQYFMSWHFPESEFSAKRVTVRQLLSHTGGLPLGDVFTIYSPPEEMPSLREKLTKEAVLVREPGSAFSYSNTGYNMLELLIEEVTGQAFNDYMRREILIPLGMNRSTFIWNERFDPAVPVGYDLRGKPVPAYVYPEKASGGLFATAEDIATFTIAGMKDAPHDKQILSPDTIEALYTPESKEIGIYGLVFDAKYPCIANCFETNKIDRFAIEKYNVISIMPLWIQQQQENNLHKVADMQGINDFFYKAIDFMSVTNNIVQFIVFLMAVIAVFFVFSNKYLYPIKILLKPLGIKSRYILKAIILCRKNPRKYIRIFCEYFILKSQGQHKDKNWWKDNYKEFVAFFRDSLPDNFIYEIDNCTDILSEGVSSKVDCYFDYFDQQKIRKKYDLDRNLPISFCMEIKIKQGFLSPNFLLSGLLDRYKNNWGNLVRKYISLTCNEKDTSFYSSEIYYTFAWLLWGPSYQMKHQEGHYKLCQYAFGDESNSLHVVLNNNEKLNGLWNSITNHSNGVLCELTCRLYKAKKYIDYYREEFSPLNIYFINKVAIESTGFLLEPIEFDIKKNYAALNYYCTAYVWIMFESITDEDSCFQPSKAITFFEHANLANKDSYEACINSLITKCFEHFDRMFSIDDIEKKYRYCLSMNAYIESKFLERYKTRIEQDDELAQKYRSCVIINMSCDESDVFSSLDAFFSNSYDDLSLVEVNIQDKRSVAHLGEYYTSIYIDSFPKNERESLDNIIDYLNKKEKGWYGKNNYHVILAVDSGVTVGGLICDYFERSNCGIIEFIAVKQECQSEGIGTRLYQKAIELLRKDARNNKKNNIDYIFCEIEKADADSNKDTNNHLWFWNKMGYRKVLFNYIQPALDDGKENVNCLDLIALQLNEKIESHRGIEATKIKSFLLDYAKYAMRIEEPEKNMIISRMIEEIDLLETSIINTEAIIRST